MRCTFLYFSLAAVMIIKLSNALKGDVPSNDHTRDTTGNAIVKQSSKRASNFRRGDSYATGQLFSSAGNIVTEFFQGLGPYNSGVASNDAVSGPSIGDATLDKSISDGILGNDPVSRAILDMKNGNQFPIKDNSVPMQPRLFLLRRKQSYATLQRRSQAGEEQESKRQDKETEDKDNTEDGQYNEETDN